MKSTYACLDENNIVFDITEFDILTDDAPIVASSYVKVVDIIPNIGQVWGGEKFN
jgi:hypothetical protein